MRTRFAARRAMEAEDLIRRCMESEGLAEGEKVFQGGRGEQLPVIHGKLQTFPFDFPKEEGRFVCRFGKCSLYVLYFRTGG